VAYSRGSVNFAAGAAEPERLSGGFLSAGAFEQLGIRPTLGRTFRASKDRPGAETVIVIGHDLWRNRVGSSPSVLGRTVVANGVMPERFGFPKDEQLWLPITIDPSLSQRGQGPWYQALGRPEDCLSLELADGEGADPFRMSGKRITRGVTMRANLRGVAAFAAVVAATLAPATATPVAAQEDALLRRAREVAALSRPDPAGFDTLFGPAFLAANPLSSMATGFVQFYRDYGSVTRVDLVERTGPAAAHFNFITERGFSVSVRLSIEPEPPARLLGLQVGRPVRLAPDFAALVEGLRALPGTVSFRAARLEGSETTVVAELNPDTALAIGSEFKLYVLGTLLEEVQRGRRSWSDVLRLEEGAKSLPSGALHQWPTGSAVTLETLATLMISQSDNTATDQLLRSLGRERVERHQAAMGHASPARNVPFASTREFFVLKNDTALGSRYLAANVRGRRTILAESSAASPRPLSDRRNPARIAEIEWFASAADLVRAWRWLRDNTSAGPAAVGRAILAVNPGPEPDSRTWPFQAFKGGAEPGVLSLSFLLGSTDGNWYVVAATWNNPTAPVEQATLYGLVARAIQLLRP